MRQTLKDFVKKRVLRYSIGRLRGFGPRGNAASSAAISLSFNTRSPAPALSAACCALDAFGIGNTVILRARNASATWRGVAPCALAILASTSPALLFDDGKSSCPNGE